MRIATGAAPGENVVVNPRALGWREVSLEDDTRMVGDPHPAHTSEGDSREPPPSEAPPDGGDAVAFPADSVQPPVRPPRATTGGGTWIDPSLTPR